MATRTDGAGSARLVALIGAIGTVVLFFGEQALLPDIRDARMPYVLLRGASLAAIGLLLAYATMRFLPMRPARFGLPPVNWATLGWGLVCATAIILVGALAALALSALGHSPMKASLGDLAGRWPGLLIGYAAALAIAQELAFRGALFALLSIALKSRIAAALISLCFFILADADGFSMAQLLLPVLPGAVLTGFFLWKRDLTICIIGHFVARLVGMILVSLVATFG